MRRQRAAELPRGSLAAAVIAARDPALHDGCRQHDGKTNMRTITLEEHFAPPGFLDGAGRQLKDNIAKTGARGAKILEQLVEVGERRIADMDSAGIDMQVLSINAPGTEQLDAAEAVTVAREANEFLGAAVKKHSSRFAGLAALPTMVPDRSGEHTSEL